jgi:hypothetical protein
MLSFPLGQNARMAIIEAQAVQQPLLQRFLNIDDRKAVEALYAFHVPVFQKSPRPSFPGMQTLQELLVAKYPAAASLKESDIADSSLTDELERNGFIDRLYAGDPK